MSKIRVLVAEDHPLMRAGIAATIDAEPDMEIVGLAQDGAEALTLFRTLNPDVSLTDLRMPVLDGLGLIEAILAEQPHANIVLLTASVADISIKQALRAGVASVLLKHMCRTDLIETIRAVHRGERPLSSEVKSLLAHNTVGEALTTREIEVVRRIANGKSNREVGEELGISEYTVKGHVKAVMTKLGASDRTHAVIIALRRGFLNMDAPES
ncbi:two component transcriptional regulator, LuxR family [Granulicella pectinivorans]|uniref:Two component transcriptional regulator, LuxR family n=1 Tax=Granulicella pectinivorans TaxID=474950 RepID=A0A1I6LXK2_9BACT|nr:response regulator transcription factor [Granulicella pectinivorans]SFS08125.1 two component transcriptional regulator, LuxR family [Granulicella pectinivorans]